MSRKVLQQAHDRLEWFVDSYPRDITTSKDEFLRPIKEALAQPEQEQNTAGTVSNNIRGTDYTEIARTFEAPLLIGTKLYTSPPQRQPLRGEQIYELFVKTLPKLTLGMTYVPEWAIPIARAIEAAHNIGVNHD